MTRAPSWGQKTSSYTGEHTPGECREGNFYSSLGLLKLWVLETSASSHLNPIRKPCTWTPAGVPGSSLSCAVLQYPSRACSRCLLPKSPTFSKSGWDPEIGIFKRRTEDAAGPPDLGAGSDPVIPSLRLSKGEAGPEKALAPQIAGLGLEPVPPSAEAASPTVQVLDGSAGLSDRPGPRHMSFRAQRGSWGYKALGGGGSMVLPSVSG